MRIRRIKACTNICKKGMTKKTKDKTKEMEMRRKKTEVVKGESETRILVRRE